MDKANFNIVTHKPLVLVSPLDWGLGHTTRCIPLIKTLLSSGCDVVIACNSIQKNLLIVEFPFLRYVELAGYGIRYGKSRWMTLGWLFIQATKILTKIKQEHEWLRDLLMREKVDAVISDNRFGMYSSQLPCIFITHQLQIKTGMGPWVDAVARRWNYRRLGRFSECWVPDAADESLSLAGELSHPVTAPGIKVQYIGNLTRLKSAAISDSPTVSDNMVLVVLSGPEPQRTIFETLVLNEAVSYDGEVVVVRGLPKQRTADEEGEPDLTFSKEGVFSSNQLVTPKAKSIPSNCIIMDYAPVAVLEKLISRATVVVSRCGYTSVMDLLMLGKKTILVPTPGQAEQEYLARHLAQHQWAFTLPQKAFSFKKTIAAASSFVYKPFIPSGSSHEAAIASLVARLKC